MSFKHKDHHKGFKRRTPEEIAEKAARRTEKALERGVIPHLKNARTLQHDIWEREWKGSHPKPYCCESCGEPERWDDPESRITMMHALKRNKIGSKIEDRSDYFRAAWVCWREHKSYDFATGLDVHQKMADFVDGKN